MCFLLSTFVCKPKTITEEGRVIEFNNVDYFVILFSFLRLTHGILLNQWNYPITLKRCISSVAVCFFFHCFCVSKSAPAVVIGITLLESNRLAKKGMVNVSACVRVYVFRIKSMLGNKIIIRSLRRANLIVRPPASQPVNTHKFITNRTNEQLANLFKIHKRLMCGLILIQLQKLLKQNIIHQHTNNQERLAKGSTFWGSSISYHLLKFRTVLLYWAFGA